MTDVIDPPVTLQDTFYNLTSSINAYDSPTAAFVRSQTPLNEIGTGPGSADVDVDGNLYVVGIDLFPGDQVDYVEQFDASGTSLGKLIPDLTVYGVVLESPVVLRVTDTHLWIVARTGVFPDEIPILLQFLIDGTFVDSWTGLDAFGRLSPVAVDVDSNGLVYYTLSGSREIGVWDPVASEQRPSAVVLPADDESARGFVNFHLIPGAQGGLVAVVEVDDTVTDIVGTYVVDVYDSHGERTQRIVQRDDVALQSVIINPSLCYGETSQYVWIFEFTGGAARSLADDSALVKFDLNTGLEVTAISEATRGSVGLASYYPTGAGITRPPTIEWLWRVLGPMTTRRVFGFVTQMF